MFCVKPRVLHYVDKCSSLLYLPRETVHFIENYKIQKWGAINSIENVFFPKLAIQKKKFEMQTGEHTLCMNKIHDQNLTELYPSFIKL